MLSVVVTPQGISTIKNTISTNPMPVMEEDATTGMANICKTLINSNEKYVSVYMSQMEQSRMINSYHIHVLDMCNTYRFQ